jgi:hypothetical protein
VTAAAAAARGAMARELRHALDPVAFARERLGFEPDPWQARVMRSAARQVLLNCARQSGKSTVTAAIATHTAVFRPGSLTLLVSKAHPHGLVMPWACLKTHIKIKLSKPTPGDEFWNNRFVYSRLWSFPFLIRKGIRPTAANPPARQ